MVIENIYNKKVLKSNLSDYNDVYILIRGDITDITPFILCITKTDG